MKYSKLDAKDYARENLKGIWAAALYPFLEDGRVDEAGFESNFRHWVDDLKIAGLFVSGKQGEFFSLSLSQSESAASSLPSTVQDAPPEPSFPVPTRISTTSSSWASMPKRWALTILSFTRR